VKFKVGLLSRDLLRDTEYNQYTQRQARESILDPSTATKARLLSLNWTKSRVVTGLLTGYNTLRRRLYAMVLRSNLTCRKCRTEEEISVHALCECEALASLRHCTSGSFFLDAEDIMNLIIRTIWNLGKATGLL
jgi:hypothetical protein